MYEVEFIDVGRSKQSWSATLRGMTYRELYDSVRENRALMSGDVEFNWDRETGEGVIYVGFGRRAGEFRAKRVREEGERSARAAADIPEMPAGRKRERRGGGGS